jgi:hypothetical protein
MENSHKTISIGDATKELGISVGVLETLVEMLSEIINWGAYFC